MVKGWYANVRFNAEIAIIDLEHANSLTADIGMWPRQIYIWGV